jgi:hypothetical protein
MKKFNLFSALVIVVTTIYSFAYSKALNDPQFKWPLLSHDFGKIKNGKPVTFTFNFTNVGKAPLIVSAAKAGCECTTAKYINGPIAPGKAGHIEVTYNAAATGKFSKTISVSSNATEIPEELTITGEVVD